MSMLPDSQFPTTKTMVSQQPNNPRTLDKTNPNPISPQLQIPQLRQPLQPLNLGNLILHEKDIRQLHQMRHVLDMLEFVETQVQTRQVVEVV